MSNESGNKVVLWLIALGVAGVLACCGWFVWDRIEERRLQEHARQNAAEEASKRELELRYLSLAAAVLRAREAELRARGERENDGSNYAADRAVDAFLAATPDQQDDMVETLICVIRYGEYARVSALGFWHEVDEIYRRGPEMPAVQKLAKELHLRKKE